MSARRMPCKRCHHPKPVGPDGYCSGCAYILAQMKLRKSTPPVDGANEMDAQGGPRCACGKPSAFEDGSCVDCAVDGAKRVPKQDSSPAMAGAAAASPEPDLVGVAGGEHEPVTERSSKTPTLPPAGDEPAPIDYAAIETRAAAFAGEFGVLSPTTSAKSDPDLAVLVGEQPRTDGQSAS